MISRPRWRKVVADLWGNPTRSLLVIASIAVGLFALGIIATLYAIMSEDMRDGYASSNPANIQLRGGPFNDDTLRAVENIEGVAAAQGALLFNLRLDASPGVDPGQRDFIQIGMSALPDMADMTLNQLRPVAGTFPPGNRQIVLEQYKFEQTNAEIGDMLTVALPSGRTRQLELVGVVAEQTLGAFDSGPGFFLAPVQGYITPQTAEWLGQAPPGYYDTLYIAVTGDRGDEAHIQEVAERVRSDLEKIGYTVATSITRSAYDHPNRVYVDALVGVLVLLGLFTVFLSGFLITNTLQALMKQQVQQVGILKSLGGRRRQVVSIYLALILIFGALAAAISIPLSAQVAFAQLESLAKEVNFIFRGPRLVGWAVVLQAVLAILAPLLAALVPIIQGARISVQEALSGVSQKPPPRPGRLTRRLMQIRRFPRPLIISIRNTFRQKWRVALTLVTLSLGGGLFIGAFNVQVSLSQYVERIGQYFRGDVNLTLTQPTRVARVYQALEGVPGIRRVEGWSFALGELVLEGGVSGDTVQILAPPADTQLVEPILLEGRWIIPGDRNAVALNERFMNRFPDLDVGETLELKIEGRTTEWVVVGFFQLVGNSAGYIAYAEYNTLAELIGQPNQAATFRVVADREGLTEDEQKELGRAVEASLRANGIDVTEVQPGQALSQTSADGFAILTAFLLFLSGLTALVGSIGLAGTMSMNVMERTREIGVMRSIGATNPILMRMVIVEGVLIGGLSWLVGSLLAFPISALLSDSISMAIFGSPTSLGVTPTGFLIWLGAVILLSVLASILPARHATRLTIREVLAYE